MYPVKTDHTNINLTKEGCKDLPSTTYSHEDSDNEDTEET